MRTATMRDTLRRRNGPQGKERSRPSSTRPVLGGVKSDRRRLLLSDREGRPRDEKEEKASGDTSERFTQTREAVSRRARQDRGLGRARFRGRDDVRASALHGPDGTVLDVAV